MKRVGVTSGRAISLGPRESRWKTLDNGLLHGDCMTVTGKTLKQNHAVVVAATGGTSEGAIVNAWTVFTVAGDRHPLRRFRRSEQMLSTTAALYGLGLDD